jgi:endonuclease III
MSNGEDDEARKFAMLVCLILSAASTDKTCIENTVNLFNNQLLNPLSLSKCPEEELIPHIKTGGLFNIRTKQLIETSKIIMEEHQGKVPCSMKHLEDLPGVGKKTATIMRNEAFGFFAGIGCDKHVTNFNVALGLLECNDHQVNAKIVECAMGAWVPDHRFKEINSLIGSFAQVVTQELKHDDTVFLQKLNVAILDYVTRPFQIEALFFMIKNIRILYKKEKTEQNVSRIMNSLQNKQDKQEETA